jgi:hypothetical protein
MENDNIKQLINRFFDNELNKEEEIELFSLLAGSDEGREYFKKFNLLKQAVYNDMKAFPGSLDRKIKNGGVNAPVHKDIHHFNAQIIYRLMPYAAAIVLLFLSIFYLRKADAYENQVAGLTREVSNQNMKIELLFHALPPVEVTPNYKSTNQIYYNR